MNQQKITFLKTEFVPLLRRLNAEDKGAWGVMNAQQMVEHLADALKIANGKLVQPPQIEGETLVKYREFLMSEIPFKEGTKNSFMSEQPSPLKYPDIATAIAKLQAELDDFFSAYEQNNSLKHSNPFFGELDYSEQVQLLHKHALHHLRQFGVA